MTSPQHSSDERNRNLEMSLKPIMEKKWCFSNLNNTLLQKSLNEFADIQQERLAVRLAKITK